jgi:flagellar protein FliO/FliZ
MANVSVVGLLGRMVVSLAVVVGLMYAVAKVARKRMGVGGAGMPKPQQLHLVARHALGKGAAVAAVRAGDRLLLLGVTEHTVSLLSESELPAEQPVDVPDAERPRAASRAPAWGDLLDRARDLTVRRV